MKCPKCNKNIIIEDVADKYYCEHCNTDVTTEVRNKQEYVINSVKEISKFSRAIIFSIVGVIVILIIGINLAVFFLTKFYINGLLNKINLLLKIFLIIGIIIFIVCLILFVLKKRTKLLRNIWIVAVVLIVIPLFIYKIADIDISTKDYTTYEYIEVDNTKIPSLYSVVGKRDIVMSHEENDYYEDGSKIPMDIVVIIYASGISDSDIDLYTDKLEDVGYEKLDTEDLEIDDAIVYSKLIENKNSVVSIQQGENTSISYFILETSIEEYYESLGEKNNEQRNN